MNASTLRLGTAIIALAASAPAFAQPVTAVLRLKEKVPLETLAKNVQTLSATHGFYTPEEIRQISGPSDQDYNDLIAQLKNEGFEITSESPTHLWISVKADSSTFEQYFGAKIHFVTESLHTGLLPARTPMRNSLIASVSGLDNTRKSHNHISHVNTFKPARLGDAPSGILPDTIKTAYGFNPIYQSGATGKGQDIAIATYDGFNIDDVNQFYKMIGLKTTPAVDAVNFNGTANYNEDSAMETQLDAEFAGMIAPGANIHVFTSAENSDAGELQMFTAILDDNRAKVVNYSWGDCEKHVQSQHKDDMAKVFARAVAQGVNITVASGDSGSDSCQDNSTVGDWPAANPNVVAVGGTTLAQNSDGTFAETAWNGSGGGISSLWDLPTWQQSLGSPYTKRSYPDVSFNADPNSGQPVYIHQSGSAGWAVIGGTSMAAPQWAGFLALVGEARAATGKGLLGQLDPIIYGLSAQDRGSMFNDVTSGSNGAYSAAAGWDAVTGWGSMQAANLYARLIQ